MLAIGRALMGEPRLLLLDEPSMGLSPRLTSEVMATVRAIAAGGTACCWLNRPRHALYKRRTVAYGCIWVRWRTPAALPICLTEWVPTRTFRALPLRPALATGLSDL